VAVASRMLADKLDDIVAKRNLINGLSLAPLERLVACADIVPDVDEPVVGESQPPRKSDVLFGPGTDLGARACVGVNTIDDRILGRVGPHLAPLLFRFILSWELCNAPIVYCRIQRARRSMRALG